MAAAGLSDIRVLKEAHYPSQLFVEDSRARELIAKLPNVTPDDLKQASESVVSVQVEGRKGAVHACCGGNC